MIFKKLLNYINLIKDNYLYNDYQIKNISAILLINNTWWYYI